MNNLQLPRDSVLVTRTTEDGDKIPVSVSYPTDSGGHRNVRFHQTPDGDYIPETGHTLDGDFYYPDQKLDLGLIKELYHAIPS